MSDLPDITRILALIFDILQYTFYIHLQKAPLCNWTTLEGRFGYSQGSFLFAATLSNISVIESINQIGICLLLCPLFFQTINSLNFLWKQGIMSIVSVCPQLVSSRCCSVQFGAVRVFNSCGQSVVKVFNLMLRMYSAPLK